jgi:hypothetical protein
VFSQTHFTDFCMQGKWFFAASLFLRLPTFILHYGWENLLASENSK